MTDTPFFYQSALSHSVLYPSVDVHHKSPVIKIGLGTLTILLEACAARCLQWPVIKMREGKKGAKSIAITGSLTCSPYSMTVPKSKS